MTNKIGIGIEANLDPSGVDAGLNKIVNKVNQSNRTTYNPVSPKATRDIEDLHKRLEQLLRVDGELRRRAKATNQIGLPFDQWDMGAMYPNARARRAKEESVRSYLYGSGGAGGGGGGGGGWKQMAAGVAQSGMRAAGPAGGVAANALGTGMSAGFGAGLMGLVGGLAALGVGKLVGAIAERVSQAEDNAVAMDKLKRTLGDVNVSFNALKSVVHAGADNLKITYAEAGQLAQQFVKLGNVSGDQYKNLADELGTGVGMSRAFGLDPSQGVGVMGQMRGIGVTSNTQESRRFALLIGETIGRSGAFAKADEVMDALASYATNQTRNNLSAANVKGYAGMFSSLVGSGIPGLDPAGAAGLLGRVNSSLMAGGARGEASQFFSAQVGAGMGLDPIQMMMMREGGAFATNNEMFGKDSAYGRFMGGAGPKGGTTFLQATLDRLRKQYGGNKSMMAMAAANHLGIGINQAMGLLAVEPGQMGEMEKYGNLSKFSASGIGNLSTALYGSAGDRQSLAQGLLGRKDVSEEDKKALRGAMGTDKEREVLATLTAQYDQERTQGSDIRDSKNALDNIKVSLAEHLIPMTQAMRDGILYMAGGKSKSRSEVMADIEGLESKDRRRGIDSEFEGKLKAAGKDRGAAQQAINDLIEKNRKKVLSGEMTQEEHAREMVPLQDRLKRAMAADTLAREWHTKALEDEARETQKNLENIKKTNGTAVPVVGGDQSGAETARLMRTGTAPAMSGGTGPAQSPGNTAAAMKYFMDKGWSREQAAGLVANLIAESKLSPGAVGDGGKAYGVAQWHPDRQAEFQKWSGKSIVGSSFEDQLGFVHHELTAGNEQRAGKMLRGAKTAGQAGSVVSSYYERPKWTDMEASKRSGMAESIYGTQIPPTGALGSGTYPGVNVTADDITVRFIDQNGRPAAPPQSLQTKVQNNWRPSMGY